MDINNGNEKKIRVNAEITAPKVRLVDDQGEQHLLALDEALRMSADAGLDLVEVSPDSKPPVCRIMDYGKHKFKLNKQKAVAKKKQKQIQIKEIKIRPGIEKADYEVKLRNLIRFLQEGDKVKVTIRFRGREMAHPELGMQLLEKMKVELVDLASIEQQPKFEGRQIVMVLGAKKK